MMRLHSTLMRVTTAATIAAVMLATVFAAPREEAQAQDYLTEVGTALAGWTAPYTDFAEKGQEIIDDFTVIFDTTWMGEWLADLDAMDGVAASLGAISLPSDADASLVSLIDEISSNVPDQTQAAREGMDNIAGDSGAALTAAYGELADTTDQIAAAAALVQSAGGDVPEPSSSGNAGLATGSSTPAATFALLALLAIALVGGARLATERVATKRQS
jgi:hypothetical protein